MLAFDFARAVPRKRRPEMTIRPKWDTYFMRLAYLAATRATCDRKHVGAIIASPDHRTVATGYNGSPIGMPSCDEIGHELVEGHCVRTLHAESNAIDFAGRFAMGCSLYITVSPCYDCAKRIVGAQINRVVYDQFYASRYGKSDMVVEFMRGAGVEVVQYDHPGVTLFKQMLAAMEEKERDVLRNTIVEYGCGVCTSTADAASVKCVPHGSPRRVEP
jgi:dCMP deaminase